MILTRQHVPVLDVDATPLTVPELTDVLNRFVAEGGHHGQWWATTSTASRSSTRIRNSAPSTKQRRGAARRRAGPVAVGSRTGEAPTDPSWTTGWAPPTGSRPLGDVEGLERIAVIGAGDEANAKAVARLQDIVPDAKVDGMPGEGWNSDIEDQAVAWLARAASAAGADRPRHAPAGRGAPPPARRPAAGRLLRRGRSDRTDRRDPEAGAALARPAGPGMGLAAACCTRAGWPTAFSASRGSCWGFWLRRRDAAARASR